MRYAIYYDYKLKKEHDMLNFYVHDNNDLNDEVQRYEAANYSELWSTVKRLLAQNDDLYVVIHNASMHTSYTVEMFDDRIQIELVGSSNW